MNTAVHVNTATYAATHVATNMLGSIRSIIKGSGLDPARIRERLGRPGRGHRHVARLGAPEGRDPGGLPPRQAHG